MNKFIIICTLVFCNVLHAEKVIGDWKVAELGNFIVAKTTNASNETTGVFCGDASKACYLILSNRCSENKVSVLLINSSEGVFTVQTTCMLIEDKYVSIFDESYSKQILEVFIEGQPFGFAAALDNGYFKSIRFSGIGAKKALEEANKLRSIKKENETKSFTF